MELFFKIEDLLQPKAPTLSDRVYTVVFVIPEGNPYAGTEVFVASFSDVMGLPNDHPVRLELADSLYEFFQYGGVGVRYRLVGDPKVDQP